MPRRPRRNHSPAFKAKAALAELAQQFDVHPDKIAQLGEAREKAIQLLEGATRASATRRKKKLQPSN
jgi:transposase